MTGTEVFQMRNSCSMMLRGAASVNLSSERSRTDNRPIVAASAETGKPTEIRSPPPSVFNVLRVGFNGRTCEHNAKADRS